MKTQYSNALFLEIKTRETSQLTWNTELKLITSLFYYHAQNIKPHTCTYWIHSILYKQIIMHIKKLEEKLDELEKIMFLIYKYHHGKSATPWLCTIPSSCVILHDYKSRLYTRLSSRIIFTWLCTRIRPWLYTRPLPQASPPWSYTRPSLEKYWFPTDSWLYFL